MGHDLAVPYNMADPQSRRTFEMLRLFHPLDDVIFYTLETKVEELKQANKDSIEEFNLIIKGFEVPIVSDSILKGLNERTQECCGYNEYLKVNVFNLDMYDAVIFLDNDQRVLGNLDPVFRCAQKYFISTTGQGEALNAGFFAFKPSKQLFTDMLDVLRHVRYERDSGYDDTGFGHHDHVHLHAQFYSAAGPQGFFWYYFYLMPLTRDDATYRYNRLPGAHMLRCEINGMCDYTRGLLRTMKYPCLKYPNPPLLLHKYCSGLEYGDAQTDYAFQFCIQELASETAGRQYRVDDSSEFNSRNRLVSRIQHCNQMWQENKRLTIADMIDNQASSITKESVQLIQSDTLDFAQKLLLLPINL